MEWNVAWIWNRALRQSVSEVCTHSLCKFQPYASSPEPSPIFFRLDVAERHFRYLSAWLPNHIIIFRRFDPLLSSKSCLHSYVWPIWKPSSELLALARPTAVLFYNLLKNLLRACANWTSVECSFWERFWNSNRYYESHYACDIALRICNVYILNNLFTTYTNNVCATFLPFVQEYGECDVRRLRDNGVLVFFGKCMSLRNPDIVKTGEGLIKGYQLWLLRRRHVR